MKDDYFLIYHLGHLFPDAEGRIVTLAVKGRIESSAVGPNRELGQCSNPEQIVKL